MTQQPRKFFIQEEQGCTLAFFNLESASHRVAMAHAPDSAQLVRAMQQRWQKTPLHATAHLH